MPRAAPVACLVTALWAVPSLAQAAGSAPNADPPANAPAEPTESTGSTATGSTGGADGTSTNWAPIVWACVGVLFGGGLAVWQIRGMKRSG